MVSYQEATGLIILYLQEQVLAGSVPSKCPTIQPIQCKPIKACWRLFDRGSRKGKPVQPARADIGHRALLKADPRLPPARAASKCPTAYCEGRISLGRRAPATGC